MADCSFGFLSSTDCVLSALFYTFLFSFKSSLYALETRTQKESFTRAIFFFKQNEIAKIKEKIYISSNAHVVIFSLLFGW